MELDQITTIIVAVISSGIFVKFIDWIIGRRKQKLDVTEQVQGVYGQFVTDTERRLKEREEEAIELCKELQMVRAQNEKMAKEIDTLRQRVKTLEDENERLKKENAQLKKSKK